MARLPRRVGARDCAECMLSGLAGRCTRCCTSCRTLVGLGLDFAHGRFVELEVAGTCRSVLMTFIGSGCASTCECGCSPGDHSPGDRPASDVLNRLPECSWPRDSVDDDCSPGPTSSAARFLVGQCECECCCCTALSLMSKTEGHPSASASAECRNMNENACHPQLGGI